MPVRDRGGSDAHIALVTSWLIVAFIVVQGTLSMLTQITDELTFASRLLGILTAFVGAVLFLVIQRRATREQPVAAWMPWLVVALGSAGFAVGAWLSAALALGSLSLVLVGRALLAVGSVYVVALVAFMASQDVIAINALLFAFVVVAIGLMLYVLTRLAITVEELARARETVARLRVDEERHRISRDLHDVLGRSLVAVSLRVQTAMRLLEREPARCGEQLDEVAKMVADGQTQLRGLTVGATVLGFEDELVCARDLFARLGIRCTTDVTTAGAVGAVVDELGARVLRECVTNLLKHSRATWVEISLREESSTSVLVIVNDGASPQPAHGEGTGLADLADRAACLGGTLEAGHVTGGRFRAIARMPGVPVPDVECPERVGQRRRPLGAAS